MRGEEDLHMENTQKTERSLKDICVLLLDSDDTSLGCLSEMLRECGYRVVATTRADDVQFIINNKDEKIDLVLAELCLIEMDKYKLLEKIRMICAIPVIVVGACMKDATIFDCLHRGVEFCLKKPLMKHDLENLWQFTASPREFVAVHNLTQSLGNEINRTNKNFELGDQKNPELIRSEMQNEFRKTCDKRKEIADDKETGEHAEKDPGFDLGDQKKPKLICAEEGNNGEGSEKDKTGSFSLGEALEKWFTDPVTDIPAFEAYVFDESDFKPSESVGEWMGNDEMPLSPQESSNRDFGDEDGIKLSDLDSDLDGEGHGSTSDL